MAANSALNLKRIFFSLLSKLFPQKCQNHDLQVTSLGLPHCFPIFGKEEGLDGQLASRG